MCWKDICKETKEKRFLKNLGGGGQNVLGGHLRGSKAMMQTSKGRRGWGTPPPPQYIGIFLDKNGGQVPAAPPPLKCCNSLYQYSVAGRTWIKKKVRPMVSLPTPIGKRGKNFQEN